MKTYFRKKDRRQRTSKRSESRRFKSRKKHTNSHKSKYRDLKIAIQNIPEKNREITIKHEQLLLKKCTNMKCTYLHKSV